MPTAATAILELPVDEWSKVSWEEGRLVGFVTPRLIEKRFMGEVMEV
jgi:phosphohistidine phosphatase